MATKFRSTARGEYTYTQAVNGYRWTTRKAAFDRPEVSCVLQAECRCVDDNGKPYYRYVGPTAEFATTEDRDAFVAGWTAEAWAA